MRIMELDNLRRGWMMNPGSSPVRGIIMNFVNLDSLLPDWLMGKQNMNGYMQFDDSKSNQN